MTEARPTTKAGQALAGWNSRSQTMAETVVRIEQQAVDEWLASEEAAGRLGGALSKHVRGDGITFDVAAILEDLRKR